MAGDLQVDTAVTGISDDSTQLAARAVAIGFDGVLTQETDEDAFLPLGPIGERTDEIAIGTRIATAFTRSPMVLADMARDIQRYSDGRIILGLGSQGKGHNERRFSVDSEWERPGPRRREAVLALRHIFDGFQGEEPTLDFDGADYWDDVLADLSAA